MRSVILSLLFLVGCESPQKDEKVLYNGKTEEFYRQQNKRLLGEQTAVERKDHQRKSRKLSDQQINNPARVQENYAIARNKISKEQYEEIRERAARGDVEACYEMGQIYKYAYYGDKPNMRLARLWFNRAADSGSLKAKKQLIYLNR